MKYPLMQNNILREDLDAVIELLKQDDPKLTNGPRVVEFEEKWSEWLGVKYSTFVSSGSAANFITLQMLKLRFPNGGDVIVPPLTWVSDVASVIHHGFRPIFADIQLNTLSMSTFKILDALTPNTVAVFMTHAQGFNGLTDELLIELDNRGVMLIEDVCESHGATHRGQKLGSIGAISNFSFFYAHHMSTIEGGMVCTNDPEVYEWSRMLRSHGMTREAMSDDLRETFKRDHSDLNPDFIFFAPAFNFRNTEIGATIGLSQLPRLDENNKRRSENWALLLSLLDKTVFFTEFDLVGSSNYAHQIILRDSHVHLIDRLMNVMGSHEIEFRRGSAGGGNQLRQPYVKPYLGSARPEDFPVVEHVHNFGFYIGNYPGMTKERIEEIARILNSVVE